MSDPSVLPPFISTIPDDKKEKRGWKIILETRSEAGVVSEHELTSAVGLRIVHEKMGLVLSYGQTSLGYDGLAFHEPNGGGTVIVPYVFWHGELRVGRIIQKRPLQDREKPISNLPRGFASPNEKPFAAAKREAAEETGIREDALTLFPLMGDPINPNNAFFDTAGPGEGVKFFGLEIPESLCYADVMEDTYFTVRVRKEALASNPESKAARLAEQIIGEMTFSGIDGALQSTDGFTVMGAARLALHLKVYLKLYGSVMGHKPKPPTVPYAGTRD